MASITHSAILPPDILNKKSPSENDCISREVECLHRVFGCELIQEGGILLRLPQVVMVTGQSILHRFFYRLSVISFKYYIYLKPILRANIIRRKSLKRFDVFTVAMACVILASKVEETLKTLREVAVLSQ